MIIHLLMNKLFVFLSLLLMPFVLEAQVRADSVSVALEQLESLYWAETDKEKGASVALVRDLAVRYASVRNDDKAYVFGCEYLRHVPDDVPMMELCASASLMRGQEDEAARLYGEVLRCDSNHLQANIFLGSYYYLKGERERNDLERWFFRLKRPTRMQYARYRNRLGVIFRRTYVKARHCLQKAEQQLPSDGTDRTLMRIRQVEQTVEGIR